MPIIESTLSEGGNIGRQKIARADYSFAVDGGAVSTIALTGRAFGAHISWWYWAFSTWLVALAVLLPVTLGGLGVRESSYSALIKHAGGTAAQGASTGFALGLLLIVVNGGALLLIEIAERLGLFPEPENASAPVSVREPVPAEHV